MIYIKIICCHKTHKIYNNYSNGNATMYLGVYGYLEVDDITKNVLKSNGKAMTCMGENWKLSDNGKFINGFGYYENNVFRDCYRVKIISRKPIIDSNYSKLKELKKIKEEESQLKKRKEILLRR